MHNPTRRAKRFRRPLPSTGPPNHWHLFETNDAQFNFVPEEDSHASSSNYARHRQATQHGTLRGAVLVALIVVTIVLYFVLWEVERSSPVPVPKLNLTQRTIAPPWGGSPEGTLTRYPPTIVLDRPALRLGGEVNLFDGRTAVPSSTLGRATLNAWPVPEGRDIEDLDRQADGRIHTDEITKLNSFDAAFCNGACRFLLPVRVGEQESKARVHFMQLLTLAERLNRTIVLPNVGKSRMGACSKWPFGAYYDANGFAHASGSPDSRLAIDLEGFAKWVDERPAPLNSFVVSMESVRQDRRDVSEARIELEVLPFSIQKADVDPNILSCLEDKLSRLRASLPETALSISFDSGSLKELNVSTHLMRFLSSGLDMHTDSDFDLAMEPEYEYTPRYTNSSYLSLADVDVLVLHYDLRHPLFAASDLANFNLHYAPALYDLADRLSDNIGPFLGVHWRMENVPVQNLAWCAASLVSTLHALLQDDDTTKDVQHVWLATDHPLPLDSFVRRPGAADDDWPLNGIGSGKYGPLRKSSTFKTLSLEHDRAIEILAEAFQSGGDLEAWKLTGLAEQLRRYPHIEGRFDVSETLLSDSGVFGILDKLVIVQARVFVGGSTDCSKTSSFSKQVIEARQEMFEAERGEGAVRNVVEYFGRW